jgi:hypothetical protein
VTIAEATAKELLRISLTDALELTILIARKDPRRHPRVAARWMLRYLEEDPETTIDEECWLVRVLPHSRASVRRTQRRCFEPWPRERLGDGELKA